VTKLAGEHLASAYAASHGLHVVCLRFFSVYGPRQRPDMAFCRIVRSLLGGEPFPLVGDGRQVRDFTYVGDVVSAALLAMQRAPGGAVYNVGGGTPATLGEAIDLCENLAGRRLSLRPGGSAAGDPARTSADTTRIRGELGWRPQVALAAGLALQLEAERAGQPPSMLIPA
jgi:nucleoside-diphosphate-sugar epimerase